MTHFSIILNLLWLFSTLFMIFFPYIFASLFIIIFGSFCRSVNAGVSTARGYYSIGEEAGAWTVKCLDNCQLSNKCPCEYLGVCFSIRILHSNEINGVSLLVSVHDDLHFNAQNILTKYYYKCVFVKSSWFCCFLYARDDKKNIDQPDV